MMYLIVAEIGFAYPQAYVRKAISQLWPTISPRQSVELDGKFKRSLPHCAFFQLCSRGLLFAGIHSRGHHCGCEKGGRGRDQATNVHSGHNDN